MWTWLVLLLIATCFLGAVARRIWARHPGWPAVDRAAAASLPLAVPPLLAILTGCLGWMLFYYFNYVRLVPSVALWFGYDPYPGLEGGPIVNNVYGPATTLVYLPCGFGWDPTSAMTVAFALNLVMFFVPVTCFLAHVATGDRRGRVRLAWAIVFFLAAAVCYDPTRYLLTLRHADAPAMAFGALACFFVYRRREAIGLVDLLLASAFAVLAVASKQLAAPLVVALPLYVLVAFGVRPAVRFLACLVASGALLLALFSLAFGFQDMVLDTWTVLSRQGFQVSGFEWVIVCWRLAIATLPMLCLIALLVFLDWRARGDRPPSLRAWVRQNRWTVLLVCGVALLPLSVLARAKVMGDENSFYSVYFFVLAATVLLAESAVHHPDRSVAETSVAVMMLAALVHATLAVPVVKHAANLARAHAHEEQVAFEYARRHPGDAYFPWSQLASLQAEGELYHCEMGVMERRLTGFAPTEAHFRAHLPERMKIVAFGPSIHEGQMSVLDDLPEFSREVQVPELPGWTVFARETREP